MKNKEKWVCLGEEEWTKGFKGHWVGEEEAERKERKDGRVILFLYESRKIILIFLKKMMTH